MFFNMFSFLAKILFFLKQYDIGIDGKIIIIGKIAAR